MPHKTLLVATILLAVLLALTSPAWAALAVQEIPLNPAGLAYELNLDGQGMLWVSDSTAGEIRRINPTSGASQTYAVGGGPSDARSAVEGTAWWADFTSNQLGRLTNLYTTGTVDIWEIPGSSGLYSTAVGPDGHVWAADFFLASLYRLDPGNNRLYSYTLPNSGNGSYMAVSGQYLWLGDYVNGRILRLDMNAETNVFSWWNLPAGSYPQGIAVDAAGQVWWADTQRKLVGCLNPAGDGSYATYDPPGDRVPQMVTLAGGKVWVTLQSPGGLGVLTPPASPCQGTAPTKGSGGNKPPFTSLTATIHAAAAPAPSSPTWASQSYPEAAYQGGWMIFSLPTGGSPMGVASAAELYLVDQGRQRLAKTSLTIITERKVFLPNIRR